MSIVNKKLKPWRTVSFLILLLMLCVGMLYIARISAAEVPVEEPTEEQVVPISPPQDEEGFQQLWIQRQEAKTAGDMIGERYLEEIIQRKLDKGISNLWEYALLVMREGKTFVDKDGAVTLGEFAQRMAPDLPPVYFYEGQMLLGKDSWKLAAGIEQVVQGIKAYARNIPLATIKIINFLYIVSFGVLLAILAFCLMVFFKRLPIYFHAVREDLAGDTREMIWGAGRVFLLFLPFLLQLNILWCALVWCLVLWRYLTRGERGVVIFSLLLVVYLVPVGGAFFQFMEGPRAQVVFDMYEATYGSRKPQAVERLRLWTEDHPDDQDALFTLALTAKREGDYIDAKNYYQQVVNLNPSDAHVISNLGNLYVALGEPDQASSLYHQAIEMAPDNGVYYFNLSKALSQKSMLVLEDADENFLKARELSPKIIAAHMEIDSPRPNRMVIDYSIPLEHLRERLVAEFWRETGPSYFVLDVWLNDLSPRLPFVLPVFFSVILIVLSVFGKGRGVRWRCSLCGIISNQPVGRKEKRKNICVRCFRILKGKEMDQELKENKLRETKGFQIRMGIYDKIFPLLIPGVGHIWRGYNLRGFCYLWIFFVFVGKFFYWKGIVPPVIPFSTDGSLGGVLLIIVLFCLYYLLVLRAGYKKEGLETVKPSFSLEGIRR
jgi:tetratricopeptide (TPR) repeat protein